MTRQTQEQRWDHERDYRKHEPRPSDRLSVPIPTAVEVALLVKAVDIITGSDLIEQYARTCAAEARMEAVEITSNRIIAAIEAPLSRTNPADIIFGREDA